MALQINYAYVSHTGRVRLNNEDNFWCCGAYLPAENQGTEEIQSGEKAVSMTPLMAVFDGMGGESCGEMASYISAAICDKWYAIHKKELQRNTEQYLNNLCIDMNRAVCAYGEENKISSMGSTASIVAFCGEEAYICNLGDSPVLCYRDGTLNQLSIDHVMRGNLFGKPPLTQFVGIPEDYMLIEPSISRIRLEVGQRYLICSDGVTDMLSRIELQGLLAEDESCSAIAEKIWKKAMEKGGRDNITLILCQVTEKEKAFSAFLSKFRKGQV